MTHVSDAQKLMMFEANKKSTGIAYALWLFLGMLGGHRFYADRAGSAVLLLVLSLVGFVALPVLIVPAIWVLIDAFLIPGWIRSYNNDLVTKLNA